MTEIREGGFSLDLPGSWERAQSSEPGSIIYREDAGTGTVTVMLLAVRPSYAIADRSRLHSDYVQHRAKYERGQSPSLEQSDPVATQVDGTIEGSWSATSGELDTRQIHRVVLAGDILADFCYQASGLDEDTFTEQAETALATAVVGVESSDEGEQVPETE